MVCKLCQSECQEPPKSHIVARGFFRSSPVGLLLYTASGDGSSRKLANALWDNCLVCNDCEHKIFAPLDEYAIKIFSQKVSSVRWRGGDGFEIAVFEHVDRRNLRAFCGSLLWRCSVSNLPECRHVNIGKKYEDAIAKDLRCEDKDYRVLKSESEQQFSYIDAIVYNLTSDLYGGIALSKRIRLGLHGDSRINGFKLLIPHLSLLISIDKRPHPLKDKSNVPLMLNGRVINGSMSLAPDKDVFPYFLPIMENLPDEEERIFKTFGAYRKNAKRVRNIKITRGDSIGSDLSNGAGGSSV